MKINQVSGLITEGWNDDRLRLLEQKHIVPFVKDIERMVVEANLNTRQISKLFINVEKLAAEGGRNRTTVGKAKDLTVLINKKIDQLGAEIKKAGPVQNIDTKFNDLKTKINMTDNRVAKGFRAVSDWAKENPGKASVAVAILTAAAALTAGPAGGAVAGFLSRATKDLLQGSELSSAVGKAAKMGALAGLAGLGIEAIGDTLGDALTTANNTINPQYQTVELSYQKISNIAPNEWAEAYLVGLPDDVDPIKDSWNTATKAMGDNDYEAFKAAWSEVEAGVEQLNDPEYIQSLEGNAEDHKEWSEGIAAFAKMVDGVAAAAQGSIQASGNAKQESIQLTSSQVHTIIEQCSNTPSAVNEGPLDAIKQGVKKGASAVGKKASTVGRNMTNKVTASKLEAAWKKAGSPTDSTEIAKVLRSAGVSNETIAPAFKKVGVKFTAPSQGDSRPSQGNNDITSQINQLTSGEAAELKKYIDKLLARQSGQQSRAADPAPDSPAPDSPAPDSPAPDSPGSAPAANRKNAAPGSPGSAPAANPKNAAQSDSYEKAKSEIRKVQGGQKPMPQRTADAINNALDKLSKGSKEHGVWAAEKILGFARAGVDVSGQQQSWIANAKAGERFLTQSRYLELSRMLRENNLRWSDLGLRIHLVESTNKLVGVSLV